MIAKRPSTLVLTIVAAVIGLAYAFLVFRPTANRIAVLREQMQQSRFEITKAEQLRRAIRDVEEQLEETRGFNANWRSDSDGDVSAWITERAERAGCKLHKLAPHKSKQFELVEETSVSATLEGEFQHLFEFVRQLEQMGAAMWLTKLEAKPIGEDGKRLRCELTLSIFSAISGFSD